MRMPGRSYRGPLPPLSAEEAGLRDRLREHVQRIAGEIGERNVFRVDRLGACGEYIREVWDSQGLAVREQPLASMPAEAKNLEVELVGRARPAEIIVAGAHYDTVPSSPGANDNASGVAALLELPGLLNREGLPRTVRLVAFTNEEPPFFQTSQMGSLAYARRCRQNLEQVVGMLSLETIGFYTDRPRSQAYPLALRLFYPSRGNFIAFVGNWGSRRLVRQVVAAFRRQGRFPSEGGAFPEAVPGVSWSDQWAFWRNGYQALMVTDTAPYRYRHYHTAADTPDKLDFERTARVVSGLARVIEELAEAQHVG